MQEAEQDGTAKPSLAFALQMDIRDLGGRTSHGQPGINDRAVCQVRHIVEPRAVAHRSAEADAAMCADKAFGANGHVSDDQPAVLDAVTQDLRIRPDARVIANGDEIEGRAERCADRAVFANPVSYTHLRAHETDSYL